LVFDITWCSTGIALTSPQNHWLINGKKIGRRRGKKEKKFGPIREERKNIKQSATPLRFVTRLTLQGSYLAVPPLLLAVDEDRCPARLRDCDLCENEKCKRRLDTTNKPHFRYAMDFQGQGLAQTGETEALALIDSFATTLVPRLLDELHFRRGSPD
jgi:hypothetical protein